MRSVGDRAVRACIRAGIDCIEHRVLAEDDTIRMMAEHGRSSCPPRTSPTP
jgi:imidazolonepropionase-like amidohydrolase